MRHLSRKLLDGAVQVVGSDRLGEITVHSRVQTTFSIAFHGVGGYGDDGRVRAVFFGLSDGLRRLETVHVGHLYVHQDKIKTMRPELLDRFVPVVGHDHLVSLLSQQADCQFLVHRAVLGHQDVKRSPRFQLNCVSDFLDRLAGNRGGFGAIGFRFLAS